MNQSLEAARKVVTDLNAKLAALEARKAALEDQRDDLAYDAHTGSKAAKVKLTDVIGQIIQLDGELASFAAAIRAAEGKVQESLGVERADLERQKGEQALKLGTEMHDHAVAADKAMRDTFLHLGAIHEISLTLSRMGCPPSPALVESGLIRALKSASMSTRFKLEHLAPTERHSVVELTERWGALATAWANQKLGEKSEAA